MSATPGRLVTELIESLEGPSLLEVEVSGQMLVLNTPADPVHAENVVNWVIEMNLLEKIAEQARAIEARRAEAEAA